MKNIEKTEIMEEEIPVNSKCPYWYALQPIKIIIFL